MEKLSLARPPSTSPSAVDPELVTATRNIGQFKARLNELFVGRPIQVNKPTLKDWHDLAGNIIALATGKAYTAPETYTYGAFNNLMETVLARLGSPDFRMDPSAKLANLLTPSSSSRIFLPQSVSLPPMIAPPLSQNSVPITSASSVEGNPSAFGTPPLVPQAPQTVLAPTAVPSAKQLAEELKVKLNSLLPHEQQITDGNLNQKGWYDLARAILPRSKLVEFPEVPESATYKPLMPGILQAALTAANALTGVDQTRIQGLVAKFTAGNPGIGPGFTLGSVPAPSGAVRTTSPAPMPNPSALRTPPPPSPFLAWISSELALEKWQLMDHEKWDKVTNLEQKIMEQEQEAEALKIRLLTDSELAGAGSDTEFQTTLARLISEVPSLRTFLMFSGPSFPEPGKSLTLQQLWLNQVLINWQSESFSIKRLIAPPSKLAFSKLPNTTSAQPAVPNFTVHTASTQGRRGSMEDAHYCCTLEIRGQQVAYFGLFDGHGGSETADAAANPEQGLHQRIAERLGSLPNLDNDAAVSQAINQAFADFAASLRTPDGTTALVSLQIGNRLFTAGLGDSRALLKRANGELVQLSYDQKPDQPYELARIQKQGGFVIFYEGCFRINAALAVSRAFGDQFISQMSSTPMISVTTLNPGDTLIMGCDGVWDVLGNRQAADILQEKTQTAETLITAVFNHGSADNISAITAQFAPVVVPSTTSHRVSSSLTALPPRAASSHRPSSVKPSSALASIQTVRPTDGEQLQIAALKELLQAWLPPENPETNTPEIVQFISLLDQYPHLRDLVDVPELRQNYFAQQILHYLGFSFYEGVREIENALNFEMAYNYQIFSRVTDRNYVAPTRKAFTDLQSIPPSEIDAKKAELFQLLEKQVFLHRDILFRLKSILQNGLDDSGHPIPELEPLVKVLDESITPDRLPLRWEIWQKLLKKPKNKLALELIFEVFKPISFGYAGSAIDIFDLSLGELQVRKFIEAKTQKTLRTEREVKPEYGDVDLAPLTDETLGFHLIWVLNLLPHKYQEVKRNLQAFFISEHLTKPKVFYDDEHQRIIFGYSQHEIISILRRVGLQGRLDRIFKGEGYVIDGITGGRPAIIRQEQANFQREAAAFYARLRLPVKSATSLNPQTSVQLIDQAFAENRNGLVIGEVHHSRSSKKFLVDHMRYLKSKGVKYLFFEHLLSDVHQAELDAYFDSPPGSDLPFGLRTYLYSLDWGQSRFGGQGLDGEHSFTGVVRAAKEAGIRIIAIDHEASYTSYASGLGNHAYSATDRYRTMNHQAYLAIQHHVKPGENWVVFCGSAHITTCEGVPGVSELFGYPSIVIDDPERGRKGKLEDISTYQGAGISPDLVYLYDEASERTSLDTALARVQESRPATPPRRAVPSSDSRSSLPPPPPDRPSVTPSSVSRSVSPRALPPQAPSEVKKDQLSFEQLLTKDGQFLAFTYTEGIKTWQITGQISSAYSSARQQQLGIKAYQNAPTSWPIDGETSLNLKTYEGGKLKLIGVFPSRELAESVFREAPPTLPTVLPPREATRAKPSAPEVRRPAVRAQSVSSSIAPIPNPPRVSQALPLRVVPESRPLLSTASAPRPIHLSVTNQKDESGLIAEQTFDARELTERDINPSFWYVGGMIDRVLRAKAQALGYQATPKPTDQNFTLFRTEAEGKTPTIFTIEEGPYYQNVISFIQQNLTKLRFPIRILSPYNPSQGHWLAKCVDLIYNPETKQLIVESHVYNPFGSDTVQSKEDAPVFRPLISSQEGASLVYRNSALAQNMQRQSDGSSCGAIATDYLCRLMAGQSVDNAHPMRYSPGARELRLAQIQLIAAHTSLHDAHSFYRQQIIPTLANPVSLMQLTNANNLIQAIADLSQAEVDTEVLNFLIIQLQSVFDSRSHDRLMNGSFLNFLDSLRDQIDGIKPKGEIHQVALWYISQIRKPFESQGSRSTPIASDEFNQVIQPLIDERRIFMTIKANFRSSMSKVCGTRPPEEQRELQELWQDLNGIKTFELVPFNVYAFTTSLRSENNLWTSIFKSQLIRFFDQIKSSPVTIDAFIASLPRLRNEKAARLAEISKKILQPGVKYQRPGSKYFEVRINSDTEKLEYCFLFPNSFSSVIAPRKLEELFQELSSDLLAMVQLCLCFPNLLEHSAITPLQSQAQALVRLNNELQKNPSLVSRDVRMEILDGQPLITISGVTPEIIANLEQHTLVRIVRHDQEHSKIFVSLRQSE